MILHMLGSAGALPGRSERLPGKAVLSSAVTYSEASRPRAWRAWGKPLGFCPLRVLVLSLTHLVWSSGSYLLLTMSFRKLLVSDSSTINNGNDSALYILFFLSFFFFGDGESRILEIVHGKCSEHSLMLIEQKKSIIFETVLP